MVKLNGDASWFKNFKGDINKYSVFDGNNKSQELETLLGEFLSAYEEGSLVEKLKDEDEVPSMSFNFAWENDPNYRDKYAGHSKNLEAAEIIASETEILVIIGYSFPVFNREIDNRLFMKMNKLEKVYIQDKNPEKIRSTIENAFSIFQQRKLMNSNPFHTMKDNTEDLVSIPMVKIQEENNTDQFIIPYELYQ